MTAAQSFSSRSSRLLRCACWPLVLLVTTSQSSIAFVPPDGISSKSQRLVNSARFASSKKINGANGVNGVNGINGANGAKAAIGESKLAADASDCSYSFVVGIVGDLHIDPRKMEDYETGRQHFLPIFEESKSKVGEDSVALVSLGDLGESKSCNHNPDNPYELFAGTTQCHTIASEYLSSFGVPYEVICGNHDLEGIDEFDTDAKNLRRFLKCHGKETPQFCRQIAEKTLLVGLCSTLFRDAKYTSHEVIIDCDQIRWFEDLLKSKPADEGWRIFVFSHAPPNGSGIRIIQENHVVNGCCWLNHSDERNCRKFIELVREHRSIKGWFSGHFHLGQDYQDSITFPTMDPKEGPYPNRGSCVFVQTSVMRAGTSRDGRQQSRLLRGTKNGFEICTVDHKNGGKVRIDATITYRDDTHEVGVYAHEDEAYDHDNYFKVYQPQFNDHGYVCAEDDEVCLLTPDPITDETIAWWRLSCGRVLGVVNGMMLEFDKSTLAPLGLVMSGDELLGKQVAIVDSGLEECMINFEEDGLEGADCVDSAQEKHREQAVLVFDDDGVIVVQPNPDGSYWRKIVRNKIARMKEKRREKAAIEFAQAMLPVRTEDEAKDKVISTWGPYKTTSGVAKSTGIIGTTSKNKFKELKVYTS
mmetsp:Transcript_3019/g.6357  ORF Transcript_3019/g.6357 Transcript_3019/m.6357 type:complete len:643 (-) Transcript_3019:305-2233(-)